MKPLLLCLLLAGWPALLFAQPSVVVSAGPVAGMVLERKLQTAAFGANVSVMVALNKQFGIGAGAMPLWITGIDRVHKPVFAELGASVSKDGLVQVVLRPGYNFHRSSDRDPAQNPTSFTERTGGMYLGIGLVYRFLFGSGAGFYFRTQFDRLGYDVAVHTLVPNSRSLTTERKEANNLGAISFGIFF